MTRVIYRTATSSNGYIADEQNSLASSPPANYPGRKVPTSASSVGDVAGVLPEIAAAAGERDVWVVGEIVLTLLRRR